MADESHNIVSQSLVAIPSQSSATLLPLTKTQNVADLVPVLLDRTNYFLWKSLFIPVLKYYNMYNMVEGKEQPPPQYVTDRKGKTSSVENPAYTDWTMKDQTCMILIIATLSDDTFPYTQGCTTARDLWLNLENRFAAATKFHVLQLKAHIESLKKESTFSMEEYLEYAEDIADDLANAGSPLDDGDYVGHVLKGLPSDYDDIVTLIRARGDAVTREELHGLLVQQQPPRRTWFDSTDLFLICFIIVFGFSVLFISGERALWALEQNP